MKHNDIIRYCFKQFNSLTYRDICGEIQNNISRNYETEEEEAISFTPKSGTIENMKAFNQSTLNKLMTL